MKPMTLCAAATLTLGLLGAACDRNRDDNRPSETRTTGATMGPTEQTEPVDRSSAAQPPPAVPRMDETATPQRAPAGAPGAVPGAPPAPAVPAVPATPRGPQTPDTAPRSTDPMNSAGPGHIWTPPDREDGTRGKGEANTNGSHDIGSSSTPRSP